MTRVQSSRSRGFAPEVAAGAGRRFYRAAAAGAVAAHLAAPSSIFIRPL
jgi:hypothetical protein